MLSNQITNIVAESISNKMRSASPETVLVGSHKYQISCKVITICAVTDEDGEQIGVGVTEWNPGDEFSYDTGKKLALRRAIRNASPSFRTEFWGAYLAVCREHLKNRIAQHRAALKVAGKLVRAIMFELNEDLGKVKRGVFGCEKH